MDRVPYVNSYKLVTVENSIPMIGITVFSCHPMFCITLKIKVSDNNPKTQVQGDHYKKEIKLQSNKNHLSYKQLITVFIIIITSFLSSYQKKLRVEAEDNIQ